MSSERACALAALIIHDDGLEVTAERILAVTAAAGIEVESIWASLFEKAMKGTNVDSLLASFSAAPAAGAVCAAPAAAGAAAETSGKKEEKKVEKPESDEEMGFGLFD